MAPIAMTPMDDENGELKNEAPSPQSLSPSKQQQPSQSTPARRMFNNEDEAAIAVEFSTPATKGLLNNAGDCDDSFKSCNASVNTRFRPTPLRKLIKSGEKPFRESPGKKLFGSHNKRVSRSVLAEPTKTNSDSNDNVMMIPNSPDSVRTNDTFLLEQHELPFELDSLEHSLQQLVTRSATRPSRKAKEMTPHQEQSEQRVPQSGPALLQQAAVELSPVQHPQPQASPIQLFQQESPTKLSRKSASPIKLMRKSISPIKQARKSMSPIKQAKASPVKLMPTPKQLKQQIQKPTPRRLAAKMPIESKQQPQQMLAPQQPQRQMQPPPLAMNNSNFMTRSTTRTKLNQKNTTTSKYLLASSRKPASNGTNGGYKSTAERELAFFKSLRSSSYRK